MDRLGQLLRVTAVRLTLAYTLLFGVLALGLVFYVSYNTGQLIIGQIRAAAEEEVGELADIYRQGGANLLIRSIERRSRNPGAYLYLVSDQSGRSITGNVRSVDPGLLEKDGWSSTPFPYQPIANTTSGPKLAIAQIFELDGGLRLLVGRDIGDANGFRNVIGKAFTLALAAMLFVGLLLWFLIGRRALQRIDDVSKSSAGILAGDLSQRLPVSGTGDEFDRLSDNLNQMIARVETLNAGVRNMSDSIAHDLKTPLTRLRNRAEAALDRSGRSKKKNDEELRGIIDDADGLIRTFNALLMISQVSSGARTVELNRLDLAEVVGDVHELFVPTAEDNEVDLQLFVVGPCQVNANRELIAQAVTNLLDNALKHGAGTAMAQVLMGVEVEGKNAVISVADNGPGIPKDERDRVRERFVRLDTSRSAPGTGLGLALVEAVVKLHNGELVLEDNAPGLIAKMVIPLSS